MYRCYCDASYKELERTGSIGIIVFNSSDEVLFKQSKELGHNIVTSVHVELLALNETLLILRSQEVKNILVHIDHKGIADKINDSKYLKGKYCEMYKPIIDEIKYNLNSLQAELVWVHRKKNRIADRLSK
ncbi:ribonuclease H-like domain-containing protein [Bacillus mycoides]|uniref:ribonuclease H family protein n=1 Tax=Bacillus mycoides TaxID=1405 RepID=UPI002DF874D4|nr:ribonuclease H-like domain-containing protein [Bacillus mycoides]